MNQRFSEGGVRLVTGREMQAEDCHQRNGDEDAGQHDGDEPGGAHGLFGRRLGDAHGVDESVRDEEEKPHILSMIVPLNGSRNRASSLDESVGVGAHLFLLSLAG